MLVTGIQTFPVSFSKEQETKLFVLVTSFRPLVAYLHRQGFARFCATKYSHAIDEDDLGSHLTNVALQKGEEEYNEMHGGSGASLTYGCTFRRPSGTKRRIT